MKIELGEGTLPNIAIHPGENLAELLEAHGMDQADLARRMNRPPQAINEIIRGKKAITGETAMGLESVFDTPAHVWLNLQSLYDLTHARLVREKALKDEVERVKDFPYNDLVRLGFVPETGKAIERLRHLLSFFSVSSLDALPKVEVAAYRKASGKSHSNESLAAWLRTGELLAGKRDWPLFDEKVLKAELGNLRKLAGRDDANSVLELQQRCAKAGVVLVLLPHFERTFANGAVRWISNRPVITLSDRHKKADVFWFSVFHELGHVLRHGKRDVFIEGAGNGEGFKEEEADQFARDFLIPSNYWRNFLQTNRRKSKAAIVNFARELGIHPCIVAGRLQKEHKVSYAHMNGFRPNIQWPKEPVCHWESNAANAD